MTDDASPENLRKFLESDDPALVRMGLSMMKNIEIPEYLFPHLCIMTIGNRLSFIAEKLRRGARKHKRMDLEVIPSPLSSVEDGRHTEDELAAVKDGSTTKYDWTIDSFSCPVCGAGDFQRKKKYLLKKDKRGLFRDLGGGDYECRECNCKISEEEIRSDIVETIRRLGRRQDAFVSPVKDDWNVDTHGRLTEDELDAVEDELNSVGRLVGWTNARMWGEIRNEAENIIIDKDLDIPEFGKRDADFWRLGNADLIIKQLEKTEWLWGWFEEPPTENGYYNLNEVIQKFPWKSNSFSDGGEMAKKLLKKIIGADLGDLKERWKKMEYDHTLLLQESAEEALEKLK